MYVCTYAGRYVCMYVCVCVYVYVYVHMHVCTVFPPKRILTPEEEKARAAAQAADEKEYRQEQAEHGEHVGCACAVCRAAVCVHMSHSICTMIVQIICELGCDVHRMQTCTYIHMLMHMSHTHA